jgi:hypothetical protein
MNPTPALQQSAVQQFQTQVASQVINKLEDYLTQTLTQKCSSLVQMMKSKCYDVSQMSDECRRIWLVSLLGFCDQLDQFCVRSGMSVVRGTSCVRKDLSYDKQIALACVRFYNMMSECSLRMTNYNGRMKKDWLDCLDRVCASIQKWTPEEESDSESEYEESDSDCDCN